MGSAVVAQKADARDFPTLDQQRDCDAASRPASGQSELDREESLRTKRTQAFIAAASARFDRQLQDVRRQIRELQDAHQRNQPIGVPPGEPMMSHMIEQWPGREWSSSVRSDADSDAGSVTGSASLGGSTVWSAAGLTPEEKEDLKKIRTLMAAAGTALSRDIQELRKKMSDVQDEVTMMRGKLPSHGG